MAAPRALIVLSTVPDQKAARRIARDLVTRGLAACVNRVGPLRSTYRWQGKLRDDAEFLLVIKTSPRRYPRLERRLSEIHPYDLPEIVALPVTRGSAEYLAWMGNK